MSAVVVEPVVAPVVDAHPEGNAGDAQAPSAPVPMSFPAILRNPKLSNRFAHLQEHKQRPSGSPGAVRNAGNAKEGKRWVRRLDNTRFAANPHIIPPTASDYSLSLPSKPSTFPEPLPAYLPRTAPAPSPAPPPPNPASAYAGRFSHSLKGVRRTLRKSGKAQALVKVVEVELLGWLNTSVVLNPHQNSKGDGRVLDTSGTIVEVSRSAGQMIWSISDDKFARYIVHSVARWYGVVSYSKDTPDGTRLTHLLRLNVTRPNPHAISSVDTPPVTDIDYSSAAFDTEGSDFEIVSERDAISEADELESRGLDGSGDGEIINIHPDTGGESDAESVSSAGRAGMDSSIEGLENRTRLLSIDYQGNGSGVGHRSRLATRARTSMLPRRAFRAASSPSPIRRFPPPRTEPAFPRARPPTQEPSLAFWTFVFS